MNEVIKIFGPNRLKGDIRVSGSKNALLPIIAASTLVDEVKLQNVPNITDCYFMLSIFRELGGNFTWLDNQTLGLGFSKAKSDTLLLPYVTAVRASILFVPAILFAFDHCKIFLPGGDSFSPRPVNYHMAIFEEFGFKCSLSKNYLSINRSRRTPNRVTINLPFASVGATQQAILMATFFRVNTEIFNAAFEPEILDLMKFIKSLGVKFQVLFSRKLIRVFPAKRSKPRKSHIFKVQGDRIEFITWCILGALCGDLVRVTGYPVKWLKRPLEVIHETGARIKVESKDTVLVKTQRRIKRVSVECKPYPDFPTDAQPLLAVLATQCDGNSTITDTVFPSRFSHCEELKKMGAQITVKGNSLTVKGPTKLLGASVLSHDIRASASLIVAGIIAEGETTVDGIHHLKRGYEKFDEKLRSLGANIFTMEQEVDHFC
ncbi:MAG: UDP-N-acetylglucosamine 1-carboxyvinyltransferase [Deltaproteobacteria bacterium]|nr:UDP-N-acetylglucosamine 1-carboxyvinyltransferase [Deltaproteobacteria bacterium]